jgi:hypothetical protein
MMVAVAVVAVCLPVSIETGRIWASLPWRPWHSRLWVGQPVVTVGTAGAGTPGGSVPLAPETCCAVVHEPAWDDDSCYKGRLITVRVLQGDRAGEVQEVPRDRLRPL